MTNKTGFLTALLFALVCSAGGAQERSESVGETSTDGVTLVVGVRTDARPFSYEVPRFQQAPSAQVVNGPLGDQNFGGYVIDICDAALLAMQLGYRGKLEIRHKVVDAYTRFKLLEKTADGIDILCDPATLTDDRLKKYMASAPIYLSGITFATQVSVPAGVPCAAIIGVVADTTSSDVGIRRVLQSGNLAVYANVLRAFGNNQEGWRENRKNDAEKGTPCERVPGAPNASSKQSDPIMFLATHDEVAAAFCKGDILHYLGDIEIVNRHLRSIPGCNFNDAALTLTEERYGIFARVPPETETEKAYVLLKFYEQLSRQMYGRNSVMLRSFEATFPDYRPSQKLQAFYWSLVGDFPGSSR